MLAIDCNRRSAGNANRCNWHASPASCAIAELPIVVEAPTAHFATSNKCTCVIAGMTSRDCRRPRNPADRDWRPSISDRAIAKLPVEVSSPTAHLPADDHRASVFKASCDCRCTREVADLDGNLAGDGRAVAQLTPSIVAPTANVAARRQGTGVSHPRRNRNRITHPNNSDRIKAARGRAVTDLT